jgi:hypothetical protein
MHEPARPRLHALVTPRPLATRVAARVLFALLAASVVAALVAGVLGGLGRLGAAPALGAPWLGQALLAHAALMIGGFFGTVIGLERAVALRHPAAFAGPALSAAGAMALLAGHGALGRPLLWLASLAFCAANAAIVRRQRAAHTSLLLAAAGAWAVGNTLFAWQGLAGSALPWWFAFLVLTIAAERLEMTRLTRRRPTALPAFVAIVVLLLGSAAASSWSARDGGLLFGASLVALAGWLFAFDIARHTVRAAGLARYMAVCLLTGYAWLAAGGIAWAAMARGAPVRDLALHALGLGFVFAMVMGHAPVILPALTRQKLQFGPAFYAPLAALQASLLWRLAAGFDDLPRRSEGALLNALALLWSGLTVAGAILVWRHRHRAERAAASPRRRS